jgi:hypothetical protein
MREPLVTTVAGVPFVWPALDAPEYATDAAAEPFRRLLAHWDGKKGKSDLVLPAATSPAGLYLAADLRYLAATARRGDYLDAVEAYERAMRDAPDFADAARGQLMLGYAYLAPGLAPEAGAAFAQLARRCPESPLVADAKLGQVAALRVRRRPDEARRLLDAVDATASGEVVCRARRERAALARAADTPAAAATAYRELAALCPQALEGTGALLEYAETLVLSGDRAAARQVLAQPREPRSDEEEARLHLLGGSLAEDPNGARIEYELAADRAKTPAGLEAEMRLVLLDASERPERAAERLQALAKKPAPRTLRAAVLGEAAEVTARSGRFEEALALLDEAAGLGPEGEAQADGRRAELLGRWIASLAASDDIAGIATVYAAHTTDVDALASPEDRVTVARALARLGLHDRAVRVLHTRGGSEPTLDVVLAEQALAAGDVATARSAATALLGRGLPEDLAATARQTAVGAALATGDTEAAALAAGNDAALRVQVARALVDTPDGAERARAIITPVLEQPAPPVAAFLVAGAAAAAVEAWDAAADAYGRALAAGAAGPERLEAAAGLARAARRRGDTPTAVAALEQLGGAAAKGAKGSDVFRRAATAADRAYGVQ